MTAWLLDLNPQGDRIALWLKHPSKIARKLIKYKPIFYVVPKRVGFAEMEKILDSHPNVEQVELAQKIHPIQSHKKSPVLRVICDRLSAFSKTWHAIDELELAEVCNVDFPIVQKWMYETDFFPMAKVKYTAGNTIDSLELHDSRKIQGYLPVTEKP